MGYKEKLDRGERGSKVFSSSSSSSSSSIPGGGCSVSGFCGDLLVFWGDSLGRCFLAGSGTGASAQGHEMYE